MPEVSQVHIDTALTNVSVAYRNLAFVADQVAPLVAVRRQSDRYFIYDPQREGIRATADARSPGAEAAEVDFSLSTDSYFCEDHALSAAVPDEERDNADPPVQPEIDRVEFLSEKIGLNREIALEQTLRTGAGMSEVNFDPSERWDATNSDPMAQLEAHKWTIFMTSGQRANVLVLSYDSFKSLRNHPVIVDRIKYSSGGVVTEDLLARLLDLDRVVVGRAVRNSANPGQSPTVTPVWGYNAYLVHVPTRAGLKQVSTVSTFVWTGASGGAGGTVVERWREPRRRADMVRVQKYYDTKLVAPSTGLRMLSVVG